MAMRQDEIPSLHDWLDRDQGVNDEGFKVMDEETADWALRKLRKIEEQRKEDIALAEAEIQRIEAWQEQVCEKHQRDTDYFQGLLAEYAFKQRQSDPNWKSLKLPNGVVRFRKQQPKFNYEDDKLLDSLKAHNRTDLIKVEESPDKANLKKQFRVNGDKLFNPATGEAIDGVTIEEREDRFEWGVE